MKKRFMKVCAMALALGLFWTSVDYTVLASENTGVANPYAGIATVSANGTGSSATKLDAPTNIKWVGWNATWDVLENFDGKYSVFIYKDGSCITKFQTSENRADVLTALSEQSIAMEDGALYSFDVWASCSGYETSDHSAMSLAQEWTAINPYPAPVATMVSGDPMLSYTLTIPENGVSGKYAMKLWKGEKRIEYQSSYLTAGRTYTFNMAQHFNESGTYTFTFGYLEEDVEVTCSELTVEYIRPENEIKATVPTWSTEKEGTLLLTVPENCAGHLIRVYYVDEYNGYDKVVGFRVNTNYEDPYYDYKAGDVIEMDLSEYMTQAGKYYVKMHYVSNNLLTIANSPTYTTEIYNTGVVTEEVSGLIGDVVEQSKTDAKGAVQALVNQTDVSDLRVSMQTSKDVFDQIMALEENYKTQMNVEVGKPTISDDAKKVLPSDLLDKIGVKGAALNMNQKDSNVALEVAVPTNKIPVDTNTYKDSVQLDIKLVGNDVEMHGPLKVPVQITIPVPSGMDVNHLTILHYYADGSGAEVIDKDAFVKNGDGTISFMVDRFSTFVIAEKATASADTDDNEDATQATTPVKDNVPKTGDSLPIALPMAVTVAFGVVAIALKKRNVIKELS